MGWLGVGSGMSPRANLAQARDDLAAAGARIEETYYEWAGQLAREAASDAFRVMEDEVGLSSPPAGEIGTLAERARALVDQAQLPSAVVARAEVLDEALDPALEPDFDPGLARREGGSEDYLTEEDAREAREAATAIVDACRDRLEQA
ncbi:hypothetical protein BRD56_05850 [Thermoplasmatales archaeon SW_10_69_26]|nr:MAG: hypothetical protein BRD56_05850 [Thermoplasmatales archaeon SW_10_69_26]